MKNQLLGRVVLPALIALGISFGAAVPGHASNTANVFTTEAGQTSIPMGAARFCAERVGECGRNAEPVAMQTLTEQGWQQLLRINAEVNAAVVPVSDQDLYNTVEYWAYPNGYGDCEDYALAKRRDLIALGWPPSTLLITVVRQTNGEGHAVLTVRTDRGDIILDNLRGRVDMWNDTPYLYLKRQSQVNSAQWVGLVDHRPLKMAVR
jgi:predicted transglutaminase-like cysteine proteinase